MPCPTGLKLTFATQNLILIFPFWLVFWCFRSQLQCGVLLWRGSKIFWWFKIKTTFSSHMLFCSSIVFSHGWIFKFIFKKFSYWLFMETCIVFNLYNMSPFSSNDVHYWVARFLCLICFCFGMFCAAVNASRILDGEMFKMTLSKPKNGNAQHLRAVQVVPLRSGFRPAIVSLRELYGVRSSWLLFSSTVYCCVLANTTDCLFLFSSILNCTAFSKHLTFFNTLSIARIYAHVSVGGILIACPYTRKN